MEEIVFVSGLSEEIERVVIGKIIICRQDNEDIGDKPSPGE